MFKMDRLGQGTWHFGENRNYMKLKSKVLDMEFKME